MAWHGILGHDDVVEKLRRAVRRRRLASSFLFAGPAGIGKLAFARKFGQALLCQARPEESLDPCETCPSCTMVLAGTHPDIEIVSKPPDKSFIPIELFLGDREHRGREGMCHNLSLKPFMGGRRIAIIDDADLMNVEGANCLLKTLEEPPPRSVLILIGTSPAKQLPTIRSRCQLIRFRPLATDLLTELLVNQKVAPDRTAAARLAAHAEGSIERAMELSDAELWSFRVSLLERLAAVPLASGQLAGDVAKFVDEAGKEAPRRRARLRQIVAFAAEFYRHLMLTLSGKPPPEDAELRRFIEATLSRWPGDAAMADACLERCVDAFEQIDRNANQATLIEAWLDDLAAATLPPVPRK